MSTSNDCNGQIPRLPSDDFGLNVFLDSIAKQLSDEDFKSLKFFCTGRGGIKKATLETLTSPLSLFKILREREIISNHNLLTLQAMIWHIERKDLYQKFVRYCNDLHNSHILHTYAPNPNPEEGCDYVKFHVKGHTVFDKGYITKLRAVVSEILCCPPDFIVIRGIEETRSHLITIMIPSECTPHIEKLDTRQRQLLLSLEVDYFATNGRTVHCETRFHDKNDVRAHWLHLKKETVHSLRRRVPKPPPTIRLQSTPIDHAHSSNDLLCVPVVDLRRRKSF